MKFYDYVKVKKKKTGAISEKCLIFNATDLNDAKYQALIRVSNDFSNYDVVSHMFTDQYRKVLEVINY